MKGYKKYIIWFLIVCMLLGNVAVVSAKETEDYKTFSQFDPRWGDYVYDGGATLAFSGCMITSIAVLMAYANPDLRDVDTFNPKILAQGLPFDGNGGLQSSAYANNVDSTFSKVTDIEGYYSPQESLDIVRENWEKGYFMMLRVNGPPITDSQHWSPVVGMGKDNIPVVWDVAGGAHSDWNTWAECGITCIVFFKSSKSKSYEVMTDNGVSVQENRPTTPEEIQAVEQMIEESGLKGMPKDFVFAHDIGLPDRNSLSEVERISMETVKGEIITKDMQWFDYARVGVSFLGLCCIIYGFFLGLAYIFDKTNNIFEISLLSIITLGRYVIVDEDAREQRGYNKKNKKMYCSGSIIISRMFITIAVGLFLVSGYLFNIIYKFIYFIMERM